MLETFFEKFDQFAAAPDAVEKMRELVLRMATSGRIAESDPLDQPASELLAEVFVARDQAIRRGAAKSRVEGSPIVAGDTIDIPRSWARCMVSEVCDLQTGATPSRQQNRYFGGEIPWLVSGDVNKGEITECDGRITAEGLKNSNCKIIPADSVLIALNGQGRTRATVAILRISATLNQSLVSMTPYCPERLLPEYIFWNLRGRYRAIRDITGQDQRRGLNMKLVGQLRLPIPPLAEQRRIVAKVSDLMALCDRLEAQQQEREERHAALVRAALARFADAPTPTNLQLLFHPAYGIPPAELRKAILTLAVQGKLVTQDPDDESAEALVERASKLREQFSRVKRKKTAARLRERDDSNCSHDVPDSWTWCRLGDLVLEFRYGTSRRCARNAGGVPVLRIPNIQRGRIDSSDLKFTDMAPAEFAELRLQEGDLLLVRSNGSESLVGRSAVASAEDQRFAYAGYLVRARIPAGAVFTPFLHVALSTPAVRDQIEGPIRTTSGVKNINTTELSNLVIPLAPLAEQRRIVAKLDELIALVDELESQITASRALAVKLLSAAVAELTITQ